MSDFDGIKNSGRPLALYGLAANPPHRGHWACVTHLIGLGFDVLVVPSFAHAFGKSMSPYDLRVGWLRKAAPDFLSLRLRPRFLIWEIEAAIALEKKADERIFTIEALRAAKKKFGRAPVFAVGPDNFDQATFSRFKDHELISSDFGLVRLPETEDVRSTQVRERVSQGELGDLEGWVGPAIAEEVAAAFQSSKRAGAVPN